MKRKPWVSAICMIMVLTVLLIGWGAPPAQAATLSINKTNYAPGEKITVTFSPSTGVNDSAWIGVIPSGIAHGDGDLADQYDSDYFWVSSYSGGVGELDAPNTTGSYDVRYFTKDPGGVELASVSFTVGSGPTTGSVAINKTSYSRGEKINVTFSPSTGVASSAWIGVIPSGIAHGDGDLADQHDTDYEWVRDHANGTMQLDAPQTAGSYDVRYFTKDPGGVELASVTFSVSAGTVPGIITGPIIVPGNIPGTVIPGTLPSGIILTATPGNMQVKLDWTVPSSLTGITGYHLFRGTSAGGESTTPVTDFIITGTTHTDKNVVNGTKYYYILKPVYSGNTLGTSSNEVSATPPGSGIPGATNVIVLQIGSPFMQVNGVTKEIDPGRGTTPVIVNGRTMLPIASLVQEMGGTIAWDGAERKVIINVKNTVIWLWIDNTRTVVNGQEKFTDVPPQIINSRTMVPLRFVLENLNCQVNWESSTQTVTITYQN